MGEAYLQHGDLAVKCFLTDLAYLGEFLVSVVTIKNCCLCTSLRSRTSVPRRDFHRLSSFSSKSLTFV